MAAQMQRMRSQLEQLQAELLLYRGDSSGPYEELQVEYYLLVLSQSLQSGLGADLNLLLQILKHKVSLLEASNVELQRELQERHITCEHLMQRAVDAQVHLTGFSTPEQLLQSFCTCSMESLIYATLDVLGRKRQIDYEN